MSCDALPPGAVHISVKGLPYTFAPRSSQWRRPTTSRWQRSPQPASMGLSAFNARIYMALCLECASGSVFVAMRDGTLPAHPHSHHGLPLRAVIAQRKLHGPVSVAEPTMSVLQPCSMMVKRVSRRGKTHGVLVSCSMVMLSRSCQHCR